MKRVFAMLILLAASGLSKAQEAVPVTTDPVETAFSAIRSGQLETAENQAAAIRNPAAKYFVQACIEKAKGNPKASLETIAHGIVLYPNDPDWTAKSQLLSATLYIQLDMLDAADVAARHIQMIYEGTGFADQATALRSRIEQLKKETEEEGSIE